MDALGALVASLAALRPGQALERMGREIIVYVLAALLVLSAYVAALVGLGLVLAPRLGAAGAAFAVAGAALAGALVLVAIALVLGRMTRQRRHDSERALVAGAAATVLPHLLQSRSPLSLLAAGGIGYLAAEWMGRSGGGPRD